MRRRAGGRWRPCGPCHTDDTSHRGGRPEQNHRISGKMIVKERSEESDAGIMNAKETFLINDLPDRLVNDICLYADDSNLIAKEEEDSKLQNKLDRDLTNLEE